jgi:hypothetical protein
MEATTARLVAAVRDAERDFERVSRLKDEAYLTCAAAMETFHKALALRTAAQQELLVHLGNVAVLPGGSLAPSYHGDGR